MDSEPASISCMIGLLSPKKRHMPVSAELEVMVKSVVDVYKQHKS